MNQKTVKRNQKLVQNLIFLAVGCVVLTAVILAIVAGLEVDGIYEEEVESELQTGAEMMADLYNFAYDGDWVVEDGELYKGDEHMSGDYELMDDLHKKTDLNFTLFYNHADEKRAERVLTTLTDESGNRIVGTDVDNSIYQHVVVGGEEYYARNVVIAGVQYDNFFIPMYNSDGSCAGMVSVLMETAKVNASIRAAVLKMVVIALLIVIVLTTIGLVISKKTSEIMNRVSQNLASLAGGNLSVNVRESTIERKDELGSIGEAVKGLGDKLNEIIKGTQRMAGDLAKSGSELSESAGHASDASNQVTEAVEEISKGAISQAESVQTAALDTENIGNDIDEITDNVNNLQGYADEMKEATKTAMHALDQLMTQSGEVQESVDEIGKTIQSTNESAKAISQFSEAIAEIASQTNLLSLNASIESARAGEAGKGFAVVATEIGQLAVQSSESASKIKEIVDQLLRDSEESVEVMNKLSESFVKQSEYLDSTKNDMQGMVTNVENVSTGTGNITERIGALNTAKNNLVEIITDLSAISQENAAATEETNASMEELNATFSVINQAASDLQDLAAEMQETISYFKEGEEAVNAVSEGIEEAKNKLD